MRRDLRRHRIHRWILLTFAGSLGVLLTATASCSDQAVAAALINAQDLAVDLVNIFFTNLEIGDNASGGASEVTVQLLTAAWPGVFS